MASGPTPVSDWKTVAPDDWQTVDASKHSTYKPQPSDATIGPISYTPSPRPEGHASAYEKFENEASRFGHRVLEPAAPYVGAGVGSLFAPGPGSAIGLAAVGGFAGAKAQGKENVPAAEEGAKQAAYEVGGRIVGRVAGKALGKVATKLGEDVLEKYPLLKTLLPKTEESVSPKAVQHLTSAAATKAQAGEARQAIASTIGDIEQELTKLPPEQRNVEGFLDAVNSRKTAMNLESATAMQPIAGVRTVPTGVADRIRELVTPSMQHTAEGRAEAAYIKNAAKDFDKEWSFRELDDMRMRTRAKLDAFSRKEPVARYTAAKGDASKAVDEAILDGVRDTVYPEMDRAANKPEGYFADLKGRQSNMITLQSILDKRLKNLQGAQAVSEVAPRFSSENVSLSAHAGSLPRAGIYGIRNAISPTRELNVASKNVAKAFSTTASTLPYQVLFSNALRFSQVPHGPKTQALQQARDHGRYAHVAVGPNGHRIGSNDGQSWVDTETGEPVNGQ